MLTNQIDPSLYLVSFTAVEIVMKDFTQLMNVNPFHVYKSVLAALHTDFCFWLPLATASKQEGAPS